MGFKVSVPILLRGVSLSASPRPGILTGQINVKDMACGLGVLASKKFSYPGHSQPFYDLFFDKPVNIQSNEWHQIGVDYYGPEVSLDKWKQEEEIFRVATCGSEVVFRLQNVIESWSELKANFPRILFSC